MSDMIENAITRYKQAELDTIPEDWESTTFQEVLTGFTSGATPYRGIPEYYEGNVKWITSGELKYKVITDTEEKITEEAVRKTNLKVLPKGTFLMAITGLEAAGTRGSCGIVGAEATTNQSCMALFPTNRLITEYLYHFYVRYGNELAFKYCQGTKQQSYTGRIVKILPIHFPKSNEEQKAIAEALSDVDALIQSLDKLIAKKKAIKQGTMQRLLKSPEEGGQRLPGFSGEWEVKRLGDCLIKNPEYGINAPAVDYDGNLPVYIRITDITEDGRFSPDKKVSVNKPDSGNFLLNEGDIVLARTGASTGKSYLYNKTDGELVFAGFLIRISPYKKLYDSRFIKALLETREYWSWVTVMSMRSGQPGINGKEYAQLTFSLPPSLEEQKAIAQILSDMDQEIEALEQKREKYQSLKQGMMQELLTGKKRLV